MSPCLRELIGENFDPVYLDAHTLSLDTGPSPYMRGGESTTAEVTRAVAPVF